MFRKLFFIICMLLPLTAFSNLFLPEFKIAYFRPESGQLRKFFGDSQILYEMDFNLRLAPCAWLWTGIGYWGAHGHSDKHHVSAKVHVVPGVIGFKVTRCFCPQLQGFLGVGANYTYFRYISHKTCDDERRGKGHGGVVISAGLQLRSCLGFYFSPFAEYTWNRVVFSNCFSCGALSRSIRLGGVTAGCGIGIWF